jgi:hypothetical protein
VASTHVGFGGIGGLDGSVLPWQYRVLLGEGLIFYLAKSQVSPWGEPIPVRDLGRGTASSFRLKRDLYSLGDDGWNQVVCISISGDLSRKSYWVEGGFQAQQTRPVTIGQTRSA